MGSGTGETFTFQPPSPELTCSHLASIFYSWYDGLALTGYKRPLQAEDMWPLKPENTSKDIAQEFNKYWEPTLKQYNK